MNRARATLLLIAALLLCGCMTPDRGKQAAANEAALLKEGIVTLKSGDPAPPFSVPGADGQPADPFASPQHYTLLFFFPAVNTPNSAAELIVLSRNLEKLKGQNILVYGLAPASPEELASFAAEYKIKVPLLSDSGLAIARQYGCAVAGATYAQRALIGVGLDGKIAFNDQSHYWVTNAVKSIQTGFGLAAPPAAAPAPASAPPAAK